MDYKDNIIMYVSSNWVDCQEAKSFFAENKIPVLYKNIADEENRKELFDKYNFMVVPAIIIGDEIFSGFAWNKEKLIEKLKL
jgi:glutaredoxin